MTTDLPAKTAAATWSQRLTSAIATEARRRRLELGLSTQQVADECERLGYPIARAVLSNLENGRRENVGIAELFALATALDVAPMALLCPADPAATIEVAPERYLSRVAAAGWVIGAPDPDAIAELEDRLAEARNAAGRVQLALSAAVGPARMAQS